MNSKERVRAALHFKNPDKVPEFNLAFGDVGPLPIIYSQNWKPGWNEGEEGLFPHVRGNYNWDRPNWAKSNPNYEGNKWKSIPHEEIDEWGCIWNMKGNDQNMGHPGRASLLDWNNYQDYIRKYTPNANDKSRYEFALKMINSFNPDTYRMLLFPTFGPSQVVAAMRGFNTYLLDHRKHPRELMKALELAADYHVELMKNAFKYGLRADGIWVVDDLGEQKGPFFSPKTFKEYYESSYTYIIDEAHKLDMDVHLHCCGKIDPLLSILIDWDLDAIELDSPRMSGYQDLYPYRGKIMFWACVNIQSIYTQGTPDEVEREVWHMMRNLGTKDGGFGAYFYPTPKDLKTPRNNIKAFSRGLEKYGNYSKIPSHWWDYPTQKEWDYFNVPLLPPLEI
ncbi:MAG: uroporphyrinogen decarboxylase family protein [Promethearchaeota archaeon]